MMIDRRTMLVALLAFVPMLGTGARSTFAEEKGVAGEWTMTVPEMTFKMVLAQKGSEVTGTLDSPHGVIHVKGEFVKGALTFSGALDGGPHPLEVSAKGTLQSDGTLAGDLTSSVGDLKWTAVRDSGTKH